MTAHLRSTSARLDPTNTRRILTLLASIPLACQGGNKPPGDTTAALPRGEVSTADPLVCVPRAEDPDGDPLSWDFLWTVDGAPYEGPLGQTTHPGDTVEPAQTRNGQRWTCTVTPLSGGSAGPSASAEVRVKRPNFVFLLTDDQRFDTLWAMPIVGERLAAVGVTFEQAYVSVPLCCPVRSSVLSGGFYAHDTGVFSNFEPNGGATRFEDSDTLPTRLQAAGYETVLIGKYLNDYELLDPVIPPGWSSFVGRTDWVDYYDWSVVRGSSTPTAPGVGVEERPGVYITTWERDEAVAAVRTAEEPFFLYVGFMAPHRLNERELGGDVPYPPQVAPGDAGTFADFVPAGPGVEERDLSDKPTWIRAQEDGRTWDASFAQAQLESLQAVDRAVGDLLDALEDHGHLEDTWVVYASDNGFLWGEHQLWQKAVPYEESIRIPLIIAGPEAPRGVRDDLFVAMNLDLSPTIFELARVEGFEVPGASLVPHFEGVAHPWRSGLLLEAWTGGDRPDWAGLLSAEWKYIEHTSGERELYDRLNDPHELESRHDDPALAGLLSRLAAELAPQKGLAVTTSALDEAQVGAPYAAQLEAWGGAQPYTWEAEGLPAGLTLDGSGLLTGTPEESGRFELSVRVEDSSRSPQHGGPQWLQARLALRVRP